MKLAETASLKCRAIMALDVSEGATPVSSSSLGRFPSADKADANNNIQ